MKPRIYFHFHFFFYTAFISFVFLHLFLSFYSFFLSFFILAFICFCDVFYFSLLPPFLVSIHSNLRNTSKTVSAAINNIMPLSLLLYLHTSTLSSTELCDRMFDSLCLVPLRIKQKR